MDKLSESILVLTHWSYKDALVQTYTLPYVSIIRGIISLKQKIVVVTSEQQRLALQPGELQQINREWAANNIELVVMPYEPMGLKKMFGTLNHVFHLYRLIRKENIRTIHCFCTPAGAIGYLLSKLTGARLIIDSYEPHAESMVENGTWKADGLPYRMLFWMEKMQTHRAAFFVSTAKGMKSYAKEKYGLEPKNFFVKPACVDLQKFSIGKKDDRLVAELGLQQKIVCVYAGKLGGIYLKEEVFDFLRECYTHWGDRFRFLMLTNASREEVLQEQKRVGLPEEVVIQKFALHEEVPKYLALGDFAINPVKPVPTKQFCTSIKDGEYWATGLPVVITRNISDDSDIIEREGIGYVLRELNTVEYKKAIEKIEHLLQNNTDVTRRKIREIAVQYRSFEIAKKAYTAIYN